MAKQNATVDRRGQDLEYFKAMERETKEIYGSPSDSESEDKTETKRNEAQSRRERRKDQPYGMKEFETNHNQRNWTDEMQNQVPRRSFNDFEDFQNERMDGDFPASHRNVKSQGFYGNHDERFHGEENQKGQGRPEYYYQDQCRSRKNGFPFQSRQERESYEDDIDEEQELRQGARRKRGPSYGRSRISSPRRYPEEDEPIMDRNEKKYGHRKDGMEEYFDEEMMNKPRNRSNNREEDERDDELNVPTRRRYEREMEEYMREMNPRQLNFYQRRAPMGNAPAPRHQSSLKVHPEYYYGDEPFDTYLEGFEACALLGNWSIMEKRLMLTTLLRGSAKTYYQALSSEVKSTYNRLISRLEARFGNGSKHEQYWITAFNSKMRKNENLTSFADELLLLARRAYPKVSESTIHQLALQQLYKSLNPEANWKCIERNFTDIMQAANFLETYETYSGAQPKKNVRQSQEVQFEHTLQAIMDRVEILDKKKEKEDQQSRSQTPAGNYFRQDAMKRCYNCGDKSHLSPACPKEKKCWVCEGNHVFIRCPMYLKSNEVRRNLGSGLGNNNSSSNRSLN